MKKLTTKLMISVLSVALALCALGTSTFAWFSMNNTVTVTGMEVTTKVGNNLYIKATDTEADDYTQTAFEDADFVRGINQTVSGEIQPSSTVDGVNYFYTYDADANGKKNADAKYKTLTEQGKIEFGTETIDPYKDYVFEVKATNASSETNYVFFDKINLLYEGSEITTDHQGKAFRVAIFVQRANATLAEGATVYTGSYEAMPTTANVIYGWDITGETYQTAKSGVSAVDAAPTEISIYGKKLNSLTLADNTTKLLEVKKEETAFFKFTVRLWLEGEDKGCTTDKFLKLTDDWALDLELSFQTALTTEVDCIGSGVNAIAELSESNIVVVDADTKELKNGEVAASYEWHVFTYDSEEEEWSEDASITTETLDATKLASAGDYCYCVITTVKGNVYQSDSYVKPGA